MFLVSVVKFDDGKLSCVVIRGVQPGQSDTAHSNHQQCESAKWHGWKRVIGGQYQAFDDFVEAWAASTKFATE